MFKVIDKVPGSETQYIMETNQILKKLIERYSSLIPLEGQIDDAVNVIVASYRNGGKLLVCGNGGSAADSNHMVGELMKGFQSKRPLQSTLQNQLRQLYPEHGGFLAEHLQQGLPAIALTAHSALITAVANDQGADLIFAQQVAGYGNAGDVLLALSTSGNAQNVLNALMVAKAKGLKTIGMTGASGGKMKGNCDVLINVPETQTALVQELHLPVYHTICLMIEKEMFP